MNQYLYFIKLYDTKQDGWNNNYINIRTNSNYIINNLTLNYNDNIDGINTKEYHFVCDDTSIYIEYFNSGFYSYENYYELYYNNKLVYSSNFGSSPETLVNINIKN
jgi:hypothetical protein